MLAAYLVLYGSVRLVVESVRTDSLYIGPWPAAYWLSGALITAGIALAVSRRFGPLAKREIGPKAEPTR